MSRLSNNIRAEMAQTLVRHRFAERADALMIESRVLFGLVYDDHYGPKVRANMEALEKSFKGALNTGSELMVNLMGRMIHVGATAFGAGGIFWSPEIVARPFLKDQIGYRSHVGMLDDHVLAKRLVAFADDRKHLIEEIDPAYRRALGTLAQFQNGKKLAEGWPEAMPLIGSLIPENDRTLPVVQVAALNAEFKLPPALAA